MSSSILEKLRDRAPVILPSLLLCDFGNLEREVAALEAAGVEALHLDVMDGQFVPNFTYGLPIVEAFRRLTDMPLDVHLMMNNPGQYLAQFRDAGADLMTIHAEAVDAPRPLLEQIRELGAASGLAINPQTPVAAIEDCLDVCDLILVMSVPAGFGGQSFDRSALEKLADLRDRRNGRFILEVDGGVNGETIADCAAAGAEWFVVGSAIFRQDDYGDAVSQLAAAAN